jgi:hypothetical protein
MASPFTLSIEESVRLQVDRILQGECFHRTESMRDLLKYLAAKLLAGDADQLKEYSIGVDALGKSPSYDPRSDSTARVQIGRLRQKLAEYYQTEGALDPVIIEIPKGQLTLAYRWSAQATGAAPFAEDALNNSSETEVPANWRRRAQIAVGIAAVAIALAAVLGVTLWQERRYGTKAENPWTPQLKELWAPFLVPGRPVNISFESPMFVQMGTDQYFRDTKVNHWTAAVSSPAVIAVSKGLQVSPIGPRYHYAPFQEVNSAFLLGKLLAGRTPQTFLVRSNQLSWEQIPENNWVFIGSTGFFGELLGASPIERQFVVQQEGVRNIHPQPGEPAVFGERHSHGTASQLGFSEDGEVYAVVTQIPGPSAKSYIRYFESNVTSARLGAVEWFTDAELASELLRRLKGPTGKLPPYYEVVIRVKYKDAIPIESAYVTHRELHPKSVP